MGRLSSAIVQTQAERSALIADVPEVPEIHLDFAACIAVPQRSQRSAMIDAVTRRLLQGEEEFDRFNLKPGGKAASDFHFAVEDDPHTPNEVFDCIRWGGQFIYMSYTRSRVETLPEQFAAYGFENLRGPAFIKTGTVRFIPFFGKKLWYFVCRKTQLIRPSDLTDRFSYNVELTRALPAHVNAGSPYVVRKEIPPLSRVIGRLRAKFPDASDDVIHRRAMKFINKIFPLMLTREAAMLMILNQHLPESHRDRVPRLLQMETDDRGMTRRMWTNWMRIGGQKLSQLEFARQAADMLRVVHDCARVIHLDLRLDNMLITEKGVCFLDFGASVRDGETIETNPLLANLFSELLRSSVIQGVLRKMISQRTVTSKTLKMAAGKADRQIDLFYLAVQMNQPLLNPDFRGLVEHDPQSLEAVSLAEITQDVLKPQDSAKPVYSTAADLLKGIDRLAAKMELASGRKFKPVPQSAE